MDQSTLIIGAPDTTDDGAFSQQEEENSDDFTTPGLRFTDYMRILLILAFVVASLWFTIRFMRRTQRKNDHNTKLIAVVSNKTLSNGTILTLLRLPKGFILLASNNNSVTTIKEFSKKEELDELELQISREDTRDMPKNNFTKQLKRIAQVFSTGNIVSSNRQHSNPPRDTSHGLSSLKSIHENFKRRQSLDG